MGRIKETADVSEVDPGEGSDILRLKKRFLKDQRASAQLYFMKKNARLKQLRAVSMAKCDFCMCDEYI